MNFLPSAVTSYLTGTAESATLADSNGSAHWQDNWQDLLTAGFAGAAAALAVAILLAVYFRSRYRSSRDIVRHGLAAAALGLLAFMAYDMRHAALDYLGISATKPEMRLELHQPKATAASDIPNPTRS